MTELFIGIDPGRHTGLSWAFGGQLKGLVTLKIHKALKHVDELVNDADDILVVIEDARLRGCRFNSAAKAQGAGSVKRDSVIWQDYFSDYESLSNFAVLFVAPGKTTTKMASRDFERLTGWRKRTSNHARDAAMLIWQYVFAEQRKSKVRAGGF